MKMKENFIELNEIKFQFNPQEEEDMKRNNASMQNTSTLYCYVLQYTYILYIVYKIKFKWHFY